jgi:transposase-like protein
MVRPHRDTIGGEYPVEVDECYIGGRSRDLGQGAHDMATVGVAVEVRTRKDNEDRAAKRTNKNQGGRPLRRMIYAGRLRIRICEERTRKEMCKFVQENVLTGSIIRTDACNAYDPLASLGYSHERMALNGDHKKADAHLPLVHLIISNLKTWLLGTHHGAVARHHLQSYLSEYAFRFNRRFYPMTAFNSVLGLAAKCKSPTYDELYSGQWTHPV